MEARPAPILEFFNGTKQLLVPLFQRPYEWGPKEWDTLWADILEQYERGDDDLVALHFTGAIVTAPARSVPVGVSKFLVIDGQQRLTTIAILLCAIRSLFEPGTAKYRKLSRLLVNEDDEGLDYFKLLPTQPDRSAFQSLVRGASPDGTRFQQAFLFFKKKLAGTDSDGDPIDQERVSNAIQNRLTVVAIHLGDTDDPYLIFESLNAKGAPLTQADLIRNYLLLRLHSGDQQKLYEQAWLPMQTRLQGEQLTEFMRQYLMLSGEEVSKSTIYSVLKNRFLAAPVLDVEQELRSMDQASVLYAQIIGLLKHADPVVSRGLHRLRRWEVSTANPLILKLLSAERREAISAAEVASCLELIESFAIRRAVCGVPTNQLKRIFLSLTKDLPSRDVAKWLSGRLAEGASGRRWPKDAEFLEALHKYRAYSNPVDRCKFLLERLEEGYGHKEIADFEKATVEHIMPQTLNDDWRRMLGQNATEQHEQLLDVLGNLTLTGYNAELSNFSFLRKRELLRNSHYVLNKWIVAQDVWMARQIAERTELLFQQALTIWPRPQLD